MLGLVALAALSSAVSAVSAEEAPKDRRRVPVIYCTDLFHPHQDPDDHFDLAAIFSMDEIELLAVVLDDGPRQKKEPGRVAVEQMMAITGRNVDVAIGLAPSVDGSSGATRSPAGEFQAGVELITATLRKSDRPVVVVCVGSLRDIAATFRREPELCRTRIDRLYVFIGDAHSADDFAFREYNVQLDVDAYRCILRSRLPVYWVPCFDGGLWKNGGRASYWRASHRDLIADVDDRVKQYFIYALLKKREAPLSFLDEPVNAAEWEQVLQLERNLWCCAVFLHIAGGGYVRKGGKWRSVPRPQAEQSVTTPGPFAFERVWVDVDPSGMILYPGRDRGRAVKRFRVKDREAYPRAMTELTAQMLSSLGRSGG